MGDFSVRDNLIAGLAGSDNGGFGGTIVYGIPSITAVAGFYYSAWMTTGRRGGLPTAPTTVATLDDTSTGSLGTFTNPSAGGTNRLLLWQHFTASAAGDLIYDRLRHQGGLSMNLNTSQTTNLPIDLTSLGSRCDANGLDVDWFLEVFSAGGATNPVSCTVTYTNSGGTGSRTAVIPLAASAFPIGRMYRINDYLQAGDIAIKSIQSIQFNTASGTAGSIGIVAAKRLGLGSAPGTNGFVYDFAGSGMPKIADDACLWIPEFAGTSSTGYKTGMLKIGGVA